MYRALINILSFTILTSITEYSFWLIASVSTQTLKVLHVIHTQAADLCSNRLLSCKHLTQVSVVTLRSDLERKGEDKKRYRK